MTAADNDQDSQRADLGSVLGANNLAVAVSGLIVTAGLWMKLRIQVYLTIAVLQVAVRNRVLGQVDGRAVVRRFH
jgi:hypothetical protein